MQSLLRLLMLLAGKRLYSISELQQRFALSERTVYRHIAAIKTAGFVVNCTNGGYNVSVENSPGRHLQKLFHFTDEEVCILHKTLSLYQYASLAQQQLIRKLHALYNVQLLDQMNDKTHLKNIGQLSEAQSSKKQVVLHNYRSSHSQRIDNRIVEAFEFTAEYSGIWCYDVEDNRCKQFKIARIEAVKLLTNPWANETFHLVPFVDAFHMSAAMPVATVEALLTLSAYNLLIEEFPLTEEHIQLCNGSYLLKIPVAGFNGIGRFVMGLLDEVQVLAPQAFNDFLKEKFKKFSALTVSGSKVTEI